MENFTFHNPTKIIFGKDTISQIGMAISKYGINNILLLAGGGSIKHNGVYKQATESLKKYNISWVEHWGVQPNPTLSHANEAMEIIKVNNLQAILAIGGGSTIDEAKSIAAGYYKGDIWSNFENADGIEKALPVFTILTISATGSEMNSISVLTNVQENKKWALRSSKIFPKVSIIDPSAQFSLPWKQTVNGGIDAMSHILEFLFCGITQETTIAINESLLHTIIKSVDNLQTNQNNYVWRANLAWSATLALNGLSGVGFGGGEWSSHAIEHGISALHPNISHAEGLAVVFPAWLKYVQDFNKPAFTRWAKNIWDTNDVALAVEKMKEKFRTWGAPISLSELNIKENEIDAITDNIMQKNVIGFKRRMNRNDIVEILKLCL